MFLPLKGFRILAVEQFGAGPYGSMYLADMGAEVIKIENKSSGGDAARNTGTKIGENDSTYFQAFNLNKKSVTLDLKSTEGKNIFKHLVTRSDVVWNNLRGNQAEKLGLDYESLKTTNADIVCTHISAYGRKNDRADWPGYDYLMQAECGFLHLTGEPEAPPARFGLSMIDFMTGVVAGMGTLAALLGRAKSGGCDVDTSLFDVALHQLTYPGTWYMNHGIETQRLPRSSHPSNTPVQLFKTQDGWIFIMCMTEKFWLLLLQELDGVELAEDPRFCNMTERSKNRDALTAVLDDLLSSEPTSVWLEKLKTKVPVAPVYDLPAALDNSFVEQINMRETLDHKGKELQILRNPIQFNSERLPASPGRGLGEDNAAIMTELGFSDQLQKLKEKDVI